MSVYFEKGRGGYVYDFWFEGQRYRLRRGVRLKDTAEKAERKLKDELERAALGLPTTLPSIGTAPRFSEWAGVYWRWVERQHRLGNIKRPERIDELIRVVLRFWGAPSNTTPADTAEKPAFTPTYETPYHNLRLDDPIRDPSYILKWEEWLDERKIANDTRNHYNSTLSRFYWLALQAEYRQLAGVPFNPFAGRPRAKGRKRTAIVEPDQVTALMTAAPYHIALAISIGALAYKLRVKNILELQWSQVDFARRVIVVGDHKTDDNGRPLIVPMEPKLVVILKDARRRAKRDSTHVITYLGNPVKSIRTGVRSAVIAAGLTYGRGPADGVTFHTLRHAVNTWLGRAGTPASQQQAASGYRRADTVQRYTHLNVDDQRPVYKRVARMVDGTWRSVLRAAPVKVVRKAGVIAGELSRPKGGETGSLRAQAVKSPRRASSRQMREKH